MVGKVLSAIETAVLGQRRAAEALLGAYMAGGHVLLEGPPGVGKTLLARAFAASLGLEFARVQFTPDLMPSDILGTNVFDSGTGTFRLVRGPVFTEILMADEINRTPPKTQSALLEAMQERQVTIDGVRQGLAEGFFVVATQNPIEFEGTYPLPEAQLDRFLLRIEMGIPEPAAERALFEEAVQGRLVGWGEGALPKSVVTPDEARELRRASRRVHVEGDVLDYLVRLVAAVRTSPHVELGVSPRGALSLLEAGRAAALIAERDYVVPDDLKSLLFFCWGHRLILNAESELEGYTSRRVLEDVAKNVGVEGHKGEHP
jgi:MoxR-like ATPase